SQVAARREGSVIEMLCLRWGFYFNASDKDHGSDDLSFMAQYIDKETSKKQDPKDNTVTARKITLLLFLSRILILKYCLLIPDEAQILGDQGDGLFVSSSSDSQPRPALSPILHGFRDPGERSELTIIYCGTGLSIRTLHWALCSGDGVKEYGSPMFPHLEFIGWQGNESIISFIDRIKNQLLDEDLKHRIDVLLPPEALSLLHKRLTGRFRPIVTAVEGIISTNDPAKWETIITNTEAMLSSWKDKERRGNLVGELLRTTNKMKNHPEQFSSFSSIEDTLELFLYRWYLLGETAFTILEDEALLVEAALGRIKKLGGNARVVMDEPL
ncbi:hypothetical protein BGZ76_005771, partial [Entomortierella beljakovae]